MRDKKIIEYKFVESDLMTGTITAREEGYEKGLEQLVQDSIKEGFQPYGNIIKDKYGNYIQPMVKYEDD